MELRESFISETRFPEACEYLRTAFFPKLKADGVRAFIQLLSPPVTVNEPNRFGMRKILEKRMSLRIEITTDSSARVYVTVMSRLRIAYNVVACIILGLTTCGVAALIFVPLIYLKHSRWQGATHKAVALLKEALVELTQTKSPKPPPLFQDLVNETSPP